MAKRSAYRKNRKTTTKSAAASSTATATATKQPARLSAVTTDELAREMARRQRAINSLERRREKLVTQIADIDTELRNYGAAAGATGGVRKRARNKMNLADALAELLTGQSLSVTEAADKVREAGYQTTSANFRTIVNQTLLKDPRFNKVARGLYTTK